VLPCGGRRSSWTQMWCDIGVLTRLHLDGVVGDCMEGRRGARPVARTSDRAHHTATSMMCCCCCAQRMGRRLAAGLAAGDAPTKHAAESQSAAGATSDAVGNAAGAAAQPRACPLNYDWLPSGHQVSQAKYAVANESKLAGRHQSRAQLSNARRPGMRGSRAGGPPPTAPALTRWRAAALSPRASICGM
jgi:hypothetical protein